VYFAVYFLLGYHILLVEHFYIVWIPSDSNPNGIRH